MCNEAVNPGEETPPGFWKIFPLGIFSILLTVVLFGLSTWHGNLNQDEGWYLYAASQVADGKLPYKDFAFTQGPVVPYVLSVFQPVISKWGIWGGRVVNACVGMASIFFASLLAWRLAPPGWKSFSFLSCFMLSAINAYQAYYFSVVKTYSICSFFLMLGFLFFTRAARASGWGAAMLSAIFFALAAGARISAGVAILLGGIYLLLHRKGLGNRNWLVFGFAGIGALLAIFLPFFLVAKEGFSFGMLEYHTLRQPEGNNLILKAGFVSRFVQAYFVGSVVLVGCLLANLKFYKKIRTLKGLHHPAYGISVICLTLIGITLLHLSAPFPYEDYQAFLFPLFCVALSVLLTRVFFFLPQVRVLVLFVLFLASVAGAFSSPVNQDWFVIGRDRIWWKMKKESDVHKLNRIANELKTWAGEDARLLTQDSYLAVEENFKLPKGLEMGVFSYYPDMSTEKALRLVLLNKELLVNLLQNSDCPVAAFSEYSLAISSPQIKEISKNESNEFWRLVRARYTQIKIEKDFGQGHTKLRLFKLKK